MMKQVCWHSSRSKAYRGLPEARGQSEAHGDSNLYTMQVRPCVTAKLPVLGSGFGTSFAQSCGRFLLLTWRKVLAAAGSESFMVEKSIAGLVRELNHFKQQRKALRRHLNFFRPTPSWLLPGRSTRSIACLKLAARVNWRIHKAVRWLRDHQKWKPKPEEAIDVALGCLLLRKTSSTPAVVPDAAPALAKAEVGGYISGERIHDD